MPQEKEMIPPARMPVLEYQSPTPSLVLFNETVSRLDVAYQANQPIARNTLYSTIQGADPKIIAQYPLLYFVRETRLGNSDEWVTWTWSTIPNAEDSYNASVSYLNDFAGAPIFARVYNIPRDQYDANPTLPLGSALTGVIAVRVGNGGSGYSITDRVQFDGDGTGAQAQLVIDSNGTIQNVVLTSEGSGYTTPPTVSVVTGIGAGADLTAVLQPSSAVLINQKKDELPDNDPLRNEFVRVTRIYETLPGSFITTYRADEDGKKITVQRRHNLQTVIDGNVPEDITAGVWNRRSSEPVNESYFVGWEVVESRPIPGNPLVTTENDEDGLPITITKILGDTSLIVSDEAVAGGVWVRTHKEEVSDLVAYQVQKSRVVPGNPIPEAKPNESGDIVETVRTLKETSTIVPDEIVSPGDVWIKTSSKAVTELVAWEIVEAMHLPGNFVPSIKYDGKGEAIATSKRYNKTTDITPSQTESGGIISTTETGEVSDVVSEEIQSEMRWLDEASYSLSIPNLIPEWARPQIPTIVESHIISGTASLPVLGPREFQKTEKQLTTLLFERRVEKIADITFPITATNTQTSEQYGGAVLTERLTLNEAPMTADEGFLIVSSETSTLAVYNGPSPPGLYMKRTLFNPGDAWPVLHSTHVDQTYGLVIPIDKQVIQEGTGTPGVSGGIYTEIKGNDQWRDVTIASKIDTTGWTDLGGGILQKPDDTVWTGGQMHHFPPVLWPLTVNSMDNPIIIYAEATCGCVDAFIARIQANFTHYRGEVKARYTEQFFYGGVPDDISIYQFIPQQHEFGFAFASVCGCGSDSSARVRAIAPRFNIDLCLHDELNLSVGMAFTWNFPATTPSATDYNALVGTYIMLPPRVERWRLGVWRRVKIEVMVPPMT